MKVNSDRGSFLALHTMCSLKNGVGPYSSVLRMVAPLVTTRDTYDSRDSSSLIVFSEMQQSGDSWTLCLVSATLLLLFSSHDKVTW